MTHFSLKRTLLQQLNQVTRLNYKGADKQFIPHLRNSGSLSPTMLRIGKSSPLCHPNIPLKKTRLIKSVIYASAISLKLENNWRHPSNQITTYLEKVLKNAQKPLSVKVTDKPHLNVDPLWPEFKIQAQADNLISFELSDQGLWIWTQRLNLLEQQHHEAFIKPIEIPEHALWHIQYVYSRCCTLIRLFESDHLSQSLLAPKLPASNWPIAQPLLHALINAVDVWEVDAWQQGHFQSTSIIQTVLEIAKAFESCHQQYQMASLSDTMMIPWLGIINATQQVLKSLGKEVFGLPLADRL